MSRASSPTSYRSEETMVFDAGPPTTSLNHVTTEPTWIDCPFCHGKTQTKTETAASEQQDQAASWCFFGTLGCCGWVPGMCGWFKNVDCYCSTCNKKVVTLVHDGSRHIYTPSSNTPGRVSIEVEDCRKA